MECVSVISEAPRAVPCFLPQEGSYVLIEYQKKVRRSLRKRSRRVTFEESSHSIVPVSRARLRKRSGESE